MTQQHTRNITLTKSTFFLCQCRTSEVTINTLPTWRSFQRFPLCLVLLFPGYMEDNDSQPSYGYPPHKLSSSWWLTMIDGYVWFAADRMPLTRSSQLPFRGCCLGTVPYLSAYVWWTADSSKNNMSSLFYDFRCWRKEFLSYATGFLWLFWTSEQMPILINILFFKSRFPDQKFEVIFHLYLHCGGQERQDLT